MRRALLPLLGLSAAVFSGAQTPDVSIVTDLNPNFQFREGRTSMRLYDLFGRFSTVSLQLILEGVYVVRVSQRFVRLEADNTTNQLETATFGFPDFWRIGYVDARFGRNHLIREYGLGGEIRTNLVFDQLPFVIAAIDSGERRPRGVLMRAGSKIGLSFGTGNHLATSGTSLTPIRRPEDAPGLGRGFKTLVGADSSVRIGDVDVRAEFVALRNGQTALDRDEEVFDLELRRKRTVRGPEFRIGFARTFQDVSHHYRFETEIPMDLKVSLTGQLRFDRGERTASLGVRVRF